MKKTKSIVLATALSSILTFGISGCWSTSSYSYQENESGGKELIGYFIPDDIAELYIINIKDTNENICSYIVFKRKHIYTSKFYYLYSDYYNVFNNQLICTDDNDVNESIFFENEILLYEHLAMSDIQKEQYTKDDLKMILDDYRESMVQKTLTK